MSRSAMNPLDSVWLHMESPETPMHVGVLAIFSQPKNAGAEFVSELAADLRQQQDFAEPWNRRLSTGPVARMVPAMEIDANIELD